MNEKLKPEMLAIQEKREALAEIERGERPAGFDETSEARTRGPGGWWALASIVGGALLGAWIGGAIGNARYEEPPSCFTLCGPGFDILEGALWGALSGAIAGLALWALARFASSR
ncbi:MAG TPA: hypothetical protein VGQ68_06410 [Gaiellaceae bacterium]|nr:hypothetical protein [Gaiellaceae bacterium]